MISTRTITTVETYEWDVDDWQPKSKVVTTVDEEPTRGNLPPQIRPVSWVPPCKATLMVGGTCELPQGHPDRSDHR